MTAHIKEHVIYNAGPYKGYYGQAEYDHDAEIFHGEIAGTNDVITFQGKTVEELRKAFRDSIDDYLNFCAARGEQPQKPFSGRFVVRLKPEIHWKLAVLAKHLGKSLNTVVSDYLDDAATTASLGTVKSIVAKRVTSKRPTKRRRQHA